MKRKSTTTTTATKIMIIRDIECMSVLCSILDLRSHFSLFFSLFSLNVLFALMLPTVQYLSFGLDFKSAVLNNFSVCCCFCCCWRSVTIFRPLSPLFSVPWLLYVSYSLCNNRKLILYSLLWLIWTYSYTKSQEKKEIM